MKINIIKILIELLFGYILLINHCNFKACKLGNIAKGSVYELVITLILL